MNLSLRTPRTRGGVFICHDKASHNLDEVKEKLTRVDKTYYNGVHFALETAYTKGNNKIIVEEVIHTESGRSPWDYKFFCFNGESKFLFVGSDRDTNVCFDFYDMNFKHIDVKNAHWNSTRNIIKPENFDKMIEICKILSSDFPEVRVDLYSENGKVYFGELTFYHNAALSRFEPEEFDLEFGNLWDIEPIKKLKYYKK